MAKGAITLWLSPHLAPPFDFLEKYYNTEAEVLRPTLTPVIADSIQMWVGPIASDTPAPNPVFQDWRLRNGDMGNLTIPRHGKRPSPVPETWDVHQPLFGAINVGFFDGHAEQIPIERLWQLYWSRDWQPPAKRPGLE